MMGPTFLAMSLVLVLALFALGAILFALGVRGRLSLDVPRCARCGQRVGEAEVRQSGRCPECGATLTNRSGITYFRRRSRGGVVATGVGVALLGFIVPAALALTRAGSVQVTASTTVASVAAAIRGDDEVARQLALVEAERRTAADALSDADLADLASALVAWQLRSGDASLPDTVANVLAAARARGQLSDAELLRLADAIFDDPLDDLPKEIRWRDGTTVTIHVPASETRGAITRMLVVAEARAGDDVVCRDVAPGTPIEFSLKPGTHELSLDLASAVALQGGAPTSVPTGATSSFTDRGTITVVPLDAPPILETVASPALEAAVRRACHPRRVAIDFDSSRGRCVARVDLELGSVEDVTLSYEVLLLIDGVEAELPLGHFRTTAHDSGLSRTTAVAACEIDCPPDDADIRVVFRPDPIGAEKDPNARRVVTNEIVFTDVPRVGTRSPAREASEPVGFGPKGSGPKGFGS